MSAAARQGDLTLHGGVITAGYASVLIEGKPAARVGDAHLCPLLNPGLPPPPHSGGPVLGGCPTVLIGGLAAARVGDSAACLGPPDSIGTGAASVLIGESVVAPSRADRLVLQSALASAVRTSRLQPQSAPTAQHWFDCCWVDEQQNPVTSGGLYVLDSAGVRRWMGMPEDGRLRIDGLPQPGEFSITVMQIRELTWSRDVTDFAAPVCLTCITQAVADGLPAVFSVFQVSAAGAVLPLEQVSLPIQSNQARWFWRYQNNKSPGGDVQSGWRFYATVSVANMYLRTALLTYEENESLQT